MRAGIDEIDPTLPGAYCTCGTGCEGAAEIDYKGAVMRGIDEQVAEAVADPSRTRGAAGSAPAATAAGFSETRR